MSRLLVVGATHAMSWFRDMEGSDNAPDIASTGHLKVAKEAKEFGDDPSLEEAADVVICILGACYHRGWTLRDLGLAIIRKVIVNRARTWHKTADGTWQHD